MKRFIIPLALLFLASCTANDSGVNSDAMVADSHTGQDKVPPGRDSTTLKWQLDSTTRVNISEIRTILSANPKEDQLVKSGSELKGKINELISECRMKGADHDALHAWLEPFIQDVNLLSDGKNNVNDWLKLQDDMKRFDKDFH
jgi:hypothetical protein